MNEFHCNFLSFSHFVFFVFPSYLFVISFGYFDLVSRSPVLCWWLLLLFCTYSFEAHSEFFFLFNAFGIIIRFPRAQCNIWNLKLGKRPKNGKELQTAKLNVWHRDMVRGTNYKRMVSAASSSMSSNRMYPSNVWIIIISRSTYIRNIMQTFLHSKCK